MIGEESNDIRSRRADAFMESEVISWHKQKKIQENIVPFLSLPPLCSWSLQKGCLEKEEENIVKAL